MARLADLGGRPQVTIFENPALRLVRLTELHSELQRLQAALPKRYRLVRELDRGGMSRVYLAREELPERDVAIKVLDEELSARLGRERFVREVEVTSRLQHPYIVPIHAAGDAGGALYYVMPYIEGESLRDRLDREGRLPIDEAISITRQVADALGHAHERGIVHRDVKPSNILFQSGHAVVADFGIARALRAAEAGGEFTQSGLPLGTPDYMSPEQAGGDGPVDGRTDTYALACVLYEMLAGQPPFHSRTAQATLARHLTDTMPSLRSVRPSIPPAVEQEVGRALSKAPADRHRSVVRFAEALTAAGRTATSDDGAGGVGDGTRGVGQGAEQADRARLSLTRVAAGLLLLAALGVAIQAWASGLLADDPYQASVAIMPFENRTGHPRYDYLGPSLAEGVITQLAAVPEIRVLDLYTAASVMKDSLGTPRLHDSLNVQHIIHGYIEDRDDSLIVYVSESDVEGFLSPRTRHGLAVDGIETEQVQLANRVALAFLRGVGLERYYDPRMTVVGPGRDAYLAGTEALGQRTPTAMREAVRWFREAIEMEPTSAVALSALSSAYALAVYYKYDVGMSSYEMAARSFVAADSAIALDPSVANGFAARGYIRALLGIEIDEAEADFQRAEELAPNAPNAPSWSARILAHRGRVDDAFAEAARARDLDPLQAGRRTALASLGFQLGVYDVAIEEAREAYRLEPRLSLARAFEGRALALTGRARACLSLDFDVYELVRALCLHAAGREAEARTFVETAEARLEESGIDDPGYLAELIAQDLASYYGYIGDPAGGARWVRYAFELSPAGVDERLLGSALFDPVRDDPGFASALTDARERARARVLEGRRSVESPL